MHVIMLQFMLRNLLSIYAISIILTHSGLIYKSCQYGHFMMWFMAENLHILRKKCLAQLIIRYKMKWLATRAVHVQKISFYRALLYEMIHGLESSTSYLIQTFLMNILKGNLQASAYYYYWNIDEILDDLWLSRCDIKYLILDSDLRLKTFTLVQIVYWP